MKIKNIFALVVTLVGFVACTSENELPNIPVSGELVPVTINLGSTLTKSVALEGSEGEIQNAVIAIFDSEGIPTVAPIVLNGTNTGSVRLPLIQSKAYAFVNVSDEDINALRSISNEDDFSRYSILKALSQNAGELPKFGKIDFTPTNEITIPVNQLTARLDVSVNVVVKENGVDVTEQHPEVQFTKSSLSWSGISDKSAGTAVGNDGNFTTTINGTSYNVLNRAYSYSGVKPTLNLTGSVDGREYTRSYTLGESLAADKVYVIQMKATVNLETETTVSFDYEIIGADEISVDVPEFN